MKIAIIGSTVYWEKMKRLQLKYNNKGIECRLPTFDDHAGDELSICRRNRLMIEWADEIHVFWDQRSMGTVFDFGMAFALRKKVVVEYLEEKTIGNVMRKYALTTNRTDGTR
jgi:nucleoside 2-deoxyribosyltransferase